MTIQIHITTESVEEARETLHRLAGDPNHVIVGTPSVDSLQEEVTPSQEAPDHEGYSFPQASTADAPVQEQRKEDTVSADNAPLPTMEEARAALNALRQKKGTAAVREVLKKHGVSSFTELDPNDYPQVMKEAAIDG